MRLNGLILACATPVLFQFGCAVDTDPSRELDLAQEADGDAPLPGGKADDPSWQPADTLHVGEARFDRADVGGRRIHSLWVNGSDDQPVDLAFEIHARDHGTARVALLSPLHYGDREVVAAAGYGEPTELIQFSAQLRERGEYLVVIGSHQLASESFYSVRTWCEGGACEAGTVDVLKTPKASALVGERVYAEQGLLRAELGDVFLGRDFDIEVDVWVSRPGMWWLDGELLATSVASGTQVNAYLPETVTPGDDLTLVVREAGGRVLDTGVRARFAPDDLPFARVDQILYGDLGSVTVSGVTGYYEGYANLTLRSVDRDLDIETVGVIPVSPGQVSMGLATFDVTFAPELTDELGNLNPLLPRNGEILSVGTYDQSGERNFHALGCFEFCNQLSGFETCTGGARACE